MIEIKATSMAAINGGSSRQGPAMKIEFALERIRPRAALLHARPQSAIEAAADLELAATPIRADHRGDALIEARCALLQARSVFLASAEAEIAVRAPAGAVQAALFG
jgi:hypothetical protein